MTTVSVTRMELLARKAQIALATQGRDLLEQKRTALLKEFMRTADTALERSDALERTAEQARGSLARAEAMAGAESVRSAAMASLSGLGLDVTTINVMGVRVPHIEQKRVARSALERGYSIVGASTSIDEAASAFEAEVEAIIQLAVNASRRGDPAHFTQVERPRSLRHPAPPAGAEIHPDGVGRTRTRRSLPAETGEE
jgi:V/A-type H+-transporting ATPase subunit D